MVKASKVMKAGLCGARTSKCICDRPIGHQPPHECSDHEHCDGAWWETDDEFTVWRFPKARGISKLLGLRK